MASYTLIAALALGAIGCARTEVVVEIANFNVTIPDDVDTLAISVRDITDGDRQVFALGASGGAGGGAQPLCTSLSAQNCIALPAAITLFPGSQHPDDVVSVRVTASKGQQARIDDLVEFRFTLGESQSLPISLYKSCLDVSCVAEQGICQANGQCVRPTLAGADGGSVGDLSMGDLAGADFAGVDLAGVEIASGPWQQVTSPSSDVILGLGVGPGRVYVGMRNSGVRTSVDEGGSWQPAAQLDGGAAPVTVADVAADPTNGLKAYVAGGTTDQAWWTTDGGQHFASQSFNSATVYAVIVNGSGTSFLAIAGGLAVFNGSSYQALGSAGCAFGQFVDGVAADGTANLLYAAVDNTPGGGEWQCSATGMPMTEWITPGGAGVAALGIAAENNRIWIIDTSNGLQTGNNGPPFAPVTLPASHVYRVVTQKGTSNVYLGTDVGVVKTKDGTNWRQVLATTTAVRAIAIDPSNPMIIYAGDDNGEIFRSTSGGE